MPGVRLWFSGNALVLALAAAGLMFAWYVAPALASRWGVRTHIVRLIIGLTTLGAPFVAGSGRLDTFWRAVTTRPVMAAAVTAVIVITLVAAVAERDTAGRLRVASLWSLLIIAAITLLPEGSLGWHFPGGLSACFTLDTSPGNNWLYDGLPNAVLYMPAGLLLASWLRRPTKVVVGGLFGLSLTIEVFQALFTDRACQATDVAGNVIGAALGVGLTLAIPPLAARWSGDTSDPPTPEENPSRAMTARQP